MNDWVLYTMWVILPLVSFILAVCYWLWRLKNKVELRTRELRNELFERKCAEEELRDSQKRLRLSLEEKDVLLKEIHHRVKNNLQIVSSLFYLQSEYIKDERSLEILKESRNRVRSMALIHEQLYQSDGLSRIDLDRYIHDLTTNLFASYGVQRDTIHLKIDMKDIYLGVDTAIPCGLIVNELVSNSLKHAFPSGRKGEIRLEARWYQDGGLELIVGDNGIGFPPECDVLEMESLGLRLVRTLCTQLEGEIKLDRNGGTVFTVTLTNPHERGRRRKNDYS